MTREPPGGPLCPRCLGRGEACLCARLESISTKTRVVIVQHVLEAPKASSTVRFARLALEGCDVRVYGEPTQPLTLPPLDDAWLVYPEEAPSRPPGPLPKTLVLLDASWSQARRMFQRLLPVRALPRLSLAGQPGERLRTGPEGTMSTLEALAHALAVVESAEASAHLLAVHALVCERQRRLRGYVGAQQ